MGVHIFDSLRSHDIAAPHPELLKHRETLIDPVLRATNEAIVVDASNVCRYVHEVSDKGTFGPGDFPSVVPPFPVMWIETAAPTRSDDMAWNQRWFGAQWGAMFWTDDVDQLEDAERLEYVDMMVEMRNRGYPERPVRVDRESVRWVVRSVLFVRYGGEKIPAGPIMDAWMLVDRSGSIVEAIETKEVLMWMILPGFTDPDHPLLQHAASNHNAWYAPFLLTISFMNCRNVSKTEHLPKRHEVREARRRGLPGPSKFYTLQIDPMKSVLSVEGHVRHHGLKKALHICRGHFSEYTEEKPLFGKYAGRFWIPAHVRGNAEAGKIVKDYNVKAPRNAA